MYPDSLSKRIKTVWEALRDLALVLLDCNGRRNSATTVMTTRARGRLELPGNYSIWSV